MTAAGECLGTRASPGRSTMDEARNHHEENPHRRCGLRGTRVPANLQAQPANLKARDWFQDAKFGLFIHWGVYSVLGDGEWVMNNEKIPVAEYEKLPPQFNPTKFDAAEWVAMAKDAGHEVHHHHQQAPRRLRHVRRPSRATGTSSTARRTRRTCSRCWPTRASRQGIKLFFYHSQLDWHHPDYFPRGRTGRRRRPARRRRLVQVPGLHGCPA